MLDLGVVDDLAYPSARMTGMLRNFEVFGYDPRTTLIKIGNTGSGRFPNYKFEELAYGVSLRLGERLVTIEYTPSRAFSGRGHQEMKQQSDYCGQDEHWTRVSGLDSILEPGFMSKLKKLVEAIRNNPSDVRFDDACKVAQRLGFKGMYGKGSHRAFSRQGEPTGLNFQNRSGKIAAYQARQLIAMIDKYEDELI